MRLRRPWYRRIFSLFIALALAGVLAIVALFTFLWAERRTEATLPAPTGPFAVGRTLFDWVDPTTIDRLAPIAAKREVLAWIWYPATPDPSRAMDSYWPATMRAATGPPRGPWGLLTRDALNVHGHSARDVAVSPKQTSYPIVLFRGGASAPVVGYSSLIEDLVSHGYIVVGIDAPYRSGIVAFPDGRVIGRSSENNGEICAMKPPDQQDSCIQRLLAAWTGDMGFALDQLERLNASDAAGRFTGRLDLTRVGVFGHSFGGAQAAEFCRLDARCKAGIDIDGQPFGAAVQTGLRQPFMFLLGDHRAETGAASDQIRANIQSIYDQLPPDSRQHVVIRGAFHFMFSDDGAVMKSSVLRGVLRLLGRLTIDARRQVAVTAYCVHSFFDAYLKGQGVPLHLASPLYPEIQIQ